MSLFDDSDSRSIFKDMIGVTDISDNGYPVLVIMERRFMENNNILDKITPTDQKLCARYKRSLAYTTFTERLPNFLWEIISFLNKDEPRLIEKYGDYVHFDLKRIIWSLHILLQDISDNRTLSVFYGEASDVKSWNSFLLSLKEEKDQWFSAEWLYAECYFYRRLWGIFYRSDTLKEYDYFSQHKIINSLNNKNLMLITLNETKSLKSSQKNFQLMLKLSLWANNIDRNTKELSELISNNDKNLLADQSAECWNLLTESPLEPPYIDIICNNAQFELFTDLLLAAYIIKTGLAVRVNFHFKAIPWFISNATVNDAKWLIDFLRSNEIPQLATFGRQLQRYVKNRSIIFCDNSNFWISPHEYNTMKKINPCLYVSLSGATLLIFKGDLNYRKLLGDINWETTTPFIDCLKGFLPTSICALRTINSDICCGLAKCEADWLTEDDPYWMRMGDKGVIQLAIKSRP